MNLKHILFLICLIFFNCKNKPIENNKKAISINQSKDTIINKIELVKQTYKDSSFTNIDIESTNKWLLNNQESVFVFQNKELEDNLGNELNAYVHIFNSIDDNKIVFIDSYQPEGGDPFIETYFFENVDNDINKELVILCSWEQRIKGMVEGKLYQVFVYDNYKENIISLKPMQDISSLFGIEFEGIQEGEKITAKFKTPEAIKIELKNLTQKK